MAVDLFSIIDHNLSAKGVLDLPSVMEKVIQDIKEKFPGYLPPHMADKVAAWDGKSDLTEELVERLWRQYEIGNEDYATVGYDVVMQTAIGGVTVYRKTILIIHRPEHKYANIFVLETALKILNSNREIARAVGSDRVLYISDGYPPALLEDLAIAGRDVGEIISQGILDYGPLPPDVNMGRSNYFFVDDLTESLDDLQPFELLPLYWIYDKESQDYIRPAGR